MALTRTEKAKQLKELHQEFSKATSVMFSHFVGLTVKEISQLRRKLRDDGAKMKVAKKTLIRLAAKEAGLPEMNDEDLPGPVACIFSSTDPLVGAQVVFAFSKAHQKVSLIGGVFDGKFLSKEQALALAKMPGRTQLLATFAMMLRSPLVTFAGMCASPLTGFARAVSELSKKKESPATP